MEYYLHIKPSFNCLIKCNELEQLLKKDRLHTFLIKEQSTLPLSFYPTDEENKNSLPFACSLTFNKENLNVDKKQIEVIKFPDNNYLLEVKPFLFNYPKSFENKTESLKFGDTTHTINWLNNEPCNIKVSCENGFIEVPINKGVSSLTFKTKNNVLLGYGKTQNNTYIVFCIKYENKKYNLINQQEVDILEVDDNSITTYKKLNDFAGHGKIITYALENNFNEQITLAYNYDLPLIAKHKEFIPYAFFEAVKLQNYKLARTYLTQELSNKLTNTHFQKFFGEFKSVHQTLSPVFNYEEIALIYAGKPNTAKIFNIKLNSYNKIENIFES